MEFGFISEYCISIPVIKTLPFYPRASEQGNVIGSVRIYIYIYIYMCVQIFFVIERTRDLIYLKFVSDRLLPENN